MQSVRVVPLGSCVIAVVLVTMTTTSADSPRDVLSKYIVHVYS